METEWDQNKAKEREAFESWMKERGSDPFKRIDGCYDNLVIQGMWLGWWERSMQEEIVS